MNVAQQIPRRIRSPFRGPVRRDFSYGLCSRNGNQFTSNPPRRPPLSNAQLSPSETIKPPTRAFVEILEEALRNGPHLGKRKPPTQFQSPDAGDAFRPASIDQMPLQNPSATSTVIPPLPQRELKGQPKGYFYIHGVCVTKNMHVTICDHKHNPVVAISGGQLGVKHSKRQTQETAYNTTVNAFRRLAATDYEVRQVELVMKGFGPGRKGFLQAISGPQGDFIRRKIVRVTDATPLQIGGTKARNEKRN